MVMMALIDCLCLGLPSHFTTFFVAKFQYSPWKPMEWIIFFFVSDMSTDLYWV